MNVRWEQENSTSHLESTSALFQLVPEAGMVSWFCGTMDRVCEDLQVPPEVQQLMVERMEPAWPPSPTQTQTQRGISPACSNSTRQQLNKVASPGAPQRSEHMAGHSVL